MLLTATAPKTIQKLLLEKLEMHNPVFIQINPDRQNIFYEKVKRQSCECTEDDLDTLLAGIVSDLQCLKSNYPLTICYTDLQVIQVGI